MAHDTLDCYVPPHMRGRAATKATLTKAKTSKEVDHPYPASSANTQTTHQAGGEVDFLKKKLIQIESLVASLHLDLDKTMTAAKANELAVGPASPVGKPKLIQAPVQKGWSDRSEPLSYCDEPEGPALNKAAVKDTGEPKWQPIAIASMPMLRGIAGIPGAVMNNVYTKKFLTSVYGGKEYSPGLYYEPTSNPMVLPSNTYYMIDNEFEPFMPTEPGQHGAKLTAFFRDDPVVDESEIPSTENVPLFVSLAGSPDEYIYFGHYTQTRYSDTLDYDTMQRRIPDAVKEYWAEELTRADRSEWVTQALMKALFPKPEYYGRWPSYVAAGSETADSQADEKAQSNMQKYLEELRGWWDENRIKVELLKKDNILQAFEQPTAGYPAGLRLQWEYLECVKFDMNFFAAQNLIHRMPPQRL